MISHSCNKFAKFYVLDCLSNGGTKLFKSVGGCVNVWASRCWLQIIKYEWSMRQVRVIMDLSLQTLQGLIDHINQKNLTVKMNNINVERMFTKRQELCCGQSTRKFPLHLSCMLWTKFRLIYEKCTKCL